jgi:transposase
VTSGKRYTAEFKAEAIKQALTPWQSMREVAQRLGLNKHSLYHWMQQYRTNGSLPTPAAEWASPDFPDTGFR